MFSIILNWFGVVALAASPFFIDSLEGKVLAILGLAALIAQAYKLKAHNLIILNLSGIVGYSFSIYKALL
jgi:hypothetical protein